MLKFAYDYVMSAEFDRMTDERVKGNIIKHIQEREAIEAAKNPAPAPAPGGDAAPAGGAPMAGPAEAAAPDLGTLLGSM